MNEAPDETDAPDPARPDPAAEDGEWQVIHSGTADSASTPAARALMRTSDGEFRITASHADDRVGLRIELRRQEAAGAEIRALNRAGEMDDSAVQEDQDLLADLLDGIEDDEEGGSLSPLIRRVLGSNSVPRPRRADLEAHDDEDRGSEAA